MSNLISFAQQDPWIEVVLNMDTVKYVKNSSGDWWRFFFTDGTEADFNVEHKGLFDLWDVVAQGKQPRKDPYEEDVEEQTREEEQESRAQL